MPMVAVEVLGRRTQLDDVLAALHRMRVLQVEDATARTAGVPEFADASTASPASTHGRPAPDPARSRRERAASVEARLSRLLELARSVGVQGETIPVTSPIPEGLDAHQEPRQAANLVAVAAQAEACAGRLASMLDELQAMPRFQHSLTALLPLVPELRDLTDQELAALRLTTIALVLEDHDDRLVGLLREQLHEAVGLRALLVSTRTDEDTVGCLVLVSAADDDVIHQILGQDQVAHLPLPDRFSGRTLAGAVREIEQRIEQLPGLVAQAREDLRALLEPQLPAWLRLRAWARAELDILDAAARTGATRRVFVLHAWLPRGRLAPLRRELSERFGPTVVVLARAAPIEQAPVLLSNPRRWRPFQRLVGFLSLPRSGSLDPTGLMAIGLPLLFGIMVGDLGYGIALLTIGLLVQRRYRTTNPFVADLARVLVLGGAWSIVFGLLFGEFFGSLGRQLGMPALWFYRGGPEALQPLLLFALAVGAAHVTLGLLLGIVQQARIRHPRGVLERVSVLLVLSSLFLLAGVAASRLPAGAITPAVALATVGLVIACSVHGALGLLLGPLELVGAIGNVLSYLRLAAVGLASVYLANVANVLAAAGPIWLGVIVATFFHTLNLALAGFSPMIQALRLHYVEFFSKFFLDGGGAFRPFGHTTPGDDPTAVQSEDDVPAAFGHGDPPDVSGALNAPDQGRAPASVASWPVRTI